MNANAAVRTLVIVLNLAVASFGWAESPEQAATKYFEALEKSNKEALAEVVFEPSANRIGKSILAAGSMFRRKGQTEFFEMIFERVPSPAEMEAMTPIEAFAEYMCDPLPEDPADVTKRKILGVVPEGEEIAHVVYSVDGIPNLGEKSRDVITCVNQEGKWRVVVSTQVWEAYMNYLLRPAMARLSDGKAEQTKEGEPQ
ncbi:hypothetical protein [Blastopirellula marina]|uniref:Nuclear transport factor 2 family protein n=1 Tax=Blastopirellula marina TaxID=124 RepID=A0A2S8FLS4_9BACT|nr:hypothetical protein [Blastopirellula marina]PQO33116.1 hypothetical protein C5Y98_18470 [Blastopirellula marina]PTL43283.1 hypothetical protein C5Y97_18480 [Blastopirellula marina]